jgi:hypothetical protein
MAAGGDEAAATHKSSVSFLSLPTETQREILSHVCSIRHALRALLACPVWNCPN